MKRVLLLCGSGASSGFMAAAMRKAAKKRNLEISITAKSEAQLDEMLNDADIILLGPHLAYIEKDIEKNPGVVGHHIKVAVIPQDIYGTLDGEKALDFVQNIS